MCAHARNVFFDQILLKLSPRFAVVASIIDIKNQFAGTNCLNKLFKFTVVTVGTVWDFVVKRHISVVFIIPSGQNNKHCWLLFIALIDTIQGLNT